MSTDLLDRVDEYRRAARRAVEAVEAPLKRRYLALLDLADAARAERDPTLRLWAERVIWSESEVFLLGEEDDIEGPDRWEEKQLALRRAGETACSRCGSRIATPGDIAMMRRRRAERQADRKTRSGAV